MGAIFRREFCSFFTSSVAYVFMFVTYMLSGFLFYLFTLSAGTSDMTGYFAYMFLVVAIFVPILTMKSFSEEKKQKTDQGLLTAPVSLGGMVMGKYFATLVMYLIGISISLVYAIILSCFGTVDWLMVISNYAALVILGSAAIAVGIFISSLTESQMVAVIVSMLSLILLFLLQFIASIINVDFISDILNSISFYNKYNEFTYGIFNFSSVLFYISVTAIFNFLTVRIFEKRRWG